MHDLDVVSGAFKPLKNLSRERFVDTETILTATWDDGDHALLYQCENGMTYLKGKSSHLGLYGEEIECREFSKGPIKQAAFTKFAECTAYAVDSDGNLWSRGYGQEGQLARAVADETTIQFGHVQIDGDVLSVSAGWKHALAMTSTSVWGFGWNFDGQAGVKDEKAWQVSQPTMIYEGNGDMAPCQIETGYNHSAVLLRNGQVWACGDGEHHAHGMSFNESVCQLTPIPGLQDKLVQQIGCTSKATYALADGVLYVAGYNVDGRTGVGHRDELHTHVPIDFGGRRVTAFRCHEDVVIAETATREIFYWGEIAEGQVITRPQHLTGTRLPRDVFGLSQYPGTGDMVQIDAVERMGIALEGRLDSLDKQCQELHDVYQHIDDERDKNINQLQTEMNQRIASQEQAITDLQSAMEMMANEQATTQAELQQLKANQELTFHTLENHESVVSDVESTNRSAIEKLEEAQSYIQSQLEQLKASQEPVGHTVEGPATAVTAMGLSGFPGQDQQRPSHQEEWFTNPLAWALLGIHYYCIISTIYQFFGKY